MHKDGSRNVYENTLYFLYDKYYALRQVEEGIILLLLNVFGIGTKLV